MATSGSVNHSITRNLIIRDALLDCNGIEENETPTPTAISDASRRLNNFVKFINERKPLWGKVDYTIPLYDNKQSYTIGPGGNKNVNRPTALDKQARRVTTGSTIETPIEIVARTEYMGQPLKSSAGEANMFYYDPQLTLGVVYVWPVSSTASTSLSDGSTDNWTISGLAAYSGKSKDVSAEDPQPYELSFSSDGTKMYVMGNNTDTVYQYTLSTAWDVSTAVYASKSKDVSAEDTISYGMAFSADGSKMYKSGLITSTVFQYTLSTPWDVSTAAYATKSKDVSTEDGQPFDISFSSDGYAMFVMGNATSAVYQYSLSTAWDVSTATYTSRSKDVSTEDARPYSLEFSSDGSKMYVLGDNTDTAYQYTLSTPWDVSSASYSSKSKDVSDEEGNPYSISFSSDGTKMYATGPTSVTVYQYTLSTPWELSTVSEYYYTGSDISAEPGYVFIDNSGTAVEMTEGTVGSLAQYQYAWGDNDSLGADTLYVWGATDPDATSGSVKVLTTSTPPKLIVTSNRPLEDFDDAGDAPDFPQEAYEMLVANLAYLISRQYCDQARRMELKAQATQLTQEYLANDTEEANMKIQPRRRY